jgi:hypothetical protein
MNFHRAAHLGEGGTQVRQQSIGRSFGFVLLIALAAVACLAPASALAGTAHEYESSFGPDGTEATHFENPGAVAVDQSTGDVYVTDLEAGTVSKFDEAGDLA